MTQQSLGHQPLQRVRRSARPAVLLDGPHHARQRVDRGDVAVDDRERLPVVGADADLQAHHAGVRIVDDPADLETADLAGHDAVLDDRLGAAGDDRVDEREVFGLGGWWRQEGFREGREQRPAVDVPHLDREAQAGGAAGQRAGAVLGDEVERRGAVAQRPRQRRAEAALRIVLGEHPRTAGRGQRSARREGAGGGVDLVPEVVTDERLQLEAAQPAPTVDVGHADAVSSLGRLAGAVALVEALDPPARVDQLLLAGEERVALVAELDVELAALVERVVNVLPHEHRTTVSS